MTINRRALLKGLAAVPAAAAATTLIDPTPASAAGIELVPDAFKLSYRTATGVGLPSTYPTVINDLQASASLPWATVDCQRTWQSPQRRS